MGYKRFLFIPVTMGAIRCSLYSDKPRCFYTKRTQEPVATQSSPVQLKNMLSLSYRLHNAAHPRLTGSETEHLISLRISFLPPFSVMAAQPPDKNNPLLIPLKNHIQKPKAASRKHIQSLQNSHLSPARYLQSFPARTKRALKAPRFLARYTKLLQRKERRRNE